MKKILKIILLHTVVIWYLICVICYIFFKPQILSIETKHSPQLSSINSIDYRLDSSLIVNIESKKFIVHKGFETDIGAVPITLWAYLSDNQNPYINPVIVHDYLYACHNNISRQYIDIILFSYLIEQGISIRKAYEIYIAARVFGWLHFNKNNCSIRTKLNVTTK